MVTTVVSDQSRLEWQFKSYPQFVVKLTGLATQQFAKDLLGIGAFTLDTEKTARKQTIQNKIALAILVTSFLGLLLASVILIAFDRYSVREAMLQELSVLAKVVADRSPAPLEFNDKLLATETLATLSARPSIVSACIYDSDNHVFAHFFRPGTASPPCPSEPGNFRVRLEHGDVKLLQPIISEGMKIGQVFILSDLEELDKRLLRYLAIVALVLLVSTIVVSLISQYISRGVSSPILSLAEAAKKIGEGDFKQSVSIESTDEVGTLAGAFNRMSLSLKETNETLEARLDELVNEIQERENAENRRRELEEQLIQSQKMEAVGQLTGGIAHDFNNLLTIILGNLKLIMETSSQNEDEEFNELTQDALSAGHDAVDLTQSLLAFSRKQSLSPKDINLTIQFERFTRILKHALSDEINLKVHIPEDLPNIFVDGNQFESAILNLTINARDAMPNGGTLDIAASRFTVLPEETCRFSELAPGDYVMLAVTDTGSGMPPEVLEKCTEPFFTTKEVGRGSGLGLSMVYGLTKQSDGGFNIESELGQGCKIELVFPVATEVVHTEEAKPNQEDEEVLEGRETILVVEDEGRVRKLAVRNLTQLGYDVLEAEDAGEALKKLKSEAIDLVFSDVMMPGPMNGLQLADEITKRWPHLSVLLTSGFNRAMAEHPSRKKYEVMTKPYTKEQLAHSIRKTLDSSRYFSQQNQS